jgi:hypothetical protein
MTHFDFLLQELTWQILGDTINLGRQVEFVSAKEDAYVSNYKGFGNRKYNDRYPT